MLLISAILLKGVTIFWGVEKSIQFQELPLLGSSYHDSFHFAGAGIKVGFCQFLDISSLTLCLELRK